MPPRVFAYRPATVAARLGPRSGACPLSLGDLHRAASGQGALPLVCAPIAAVARGALVAAREAGAALGLLLPPGAAPEPWVRAVTGAADEVAGGLPFSLGGEVRAGGGSRQEVERAFNESWRLVAAGVTHLAVDVDAVPPADRGAVAAELGRAAHERGLGLDLFAPGQGTGGAPGPVAEVVEAMSARGSPPDAVSVRGAAPEGTAGARAEVRRLAEICAALGGLPVLRRGPTTPDLLRILAASPVRGCEDGCAAERAARLAVPWDLIGVPPEGVGGSTDLERAVAELSEEAAERLEARAYLEVAEMLDRLGAAGSGPAIAASLEAELEGR
ncbi:MAG TPA: hypothetical protein VLS93_13545 [Anaeromyxobacteraceae bacterium]|nr:hypothetical protein [Anaeromyxobacteraceae bacterium]